MEKHCLNAHGYGKKGSDLVQLLHTISTLSNGVRLAIACGVPRGEAGVLDVGAVLSHGAAGAQSEDATDAKTKQFSFTVKRFVA